MPLITCVPVQVGVPITAILGDVPAQNQTVLEARIELAKLEAQVRVGVHGVLGGKQSIYLGIGVQGYMWVGVGCIWDACEVY